MLIVIVAFSMFLSDMYNDMWVNIVGFNAIFITLSTMLFVIGKHIRKSRELLGCLIYLLLFATICILIIGNTIFLITRG